MLRLHIRLLLLNWWLGLVLRYLLLLHRILLLLLLIRCMRSNIWSLCELIRRLLLLLLLLLLHLSLLRIKLNLLLYKTCLKWGIRSLYRLIWRLIGQIGRLRKRVWSLMLNRLSELKSRRLQLRRRLLRLWLLLRISWVSLNMRLRLGLA